MRMKTLRGIVFDMDGVILDSHPAHRQAWKQFLLSVGCDPSEEKLDYILDGHKRDEILRYFLGDLTTDQITEYGKCKDEMLKRLSGKVQPVTGAVELLSTLRNAGLRIALATSAGRQRTQRLLRDLELLSHFDAVVTGDEVTAGKPDPSIYRLAANRIHELPQYLIAVEDAVSGVRSARAAGIRCAGVASAERAPALRAAGAYPVVPCLGYLLTALKGADSDSQAPMFG